MVKVTRKKYLSVKQRMVVQKNDKAITTKKEEEKTKAKCQK